MKRFHIWKRLITCLLVAALCLSVFALASCEDGKQDPGTDKEQEQAKNDDKQNQADDDKNDGKTDDDKTGDNKDDNGGEKKDDEKTDEEKKDDETPTAPVVLTEEEWDAAVKFLGVESFSYRSVTGGMMEMTVDTVFFGNAAKQTVEGEDAYVEKVGEKYYTYNYRYGVWVKEEITDDYYKNTLEQAFSKSEFSFYAGHFAEFTFDGKDTYTCKEAISYAHPAGVTILVSESKLTFNADKKVIRVEFLNDPMYPNVDPYPVTMTVDYTPVTLTLPTPATVEVTEAEWKTALSAVTAGSVTFTGDVVVDGNVIGVEATVSGGTVKLVMDGEEIYYQQQDGKYYEYRKADGKWQKTEISRPDWSTMLGEALALFAANFSKFEYDGTNKYTNNAPISDREEGVDSRSETSLSGCEAYFNLEKKLSGISFNYYHYEGDSAVHYYINLSVDVTPATVTLPTVE